MQITFNKACKNKNKNKQASGQGFLTSLTDSPLTKKQKQLQEFTINLKQGNINKYGKREKEGAASPTLNKNVNKRYDSDAGGMNESKYFPYC